VGHFEKIATPERGHCVDFCQTYCVVPFGDAPIDGCIALFGG
jgi:hypothetical protein